MGVILLKSKLIFRNVMDIKPFATVLVDVKDSWDGEPVRTKLIELLCNEQAGKAFGSGKQQNYKIYKKTL